MTGLRNAGTPELGARFEGYAIRPQVCVVLTGPTAVLDVLRSLQESAKAIRRMGLPVPGRVQHLIALCEAELAAYRATSVVGNAELPFEPELPESAAEDLVDVAEAAELLGVTPRQVRNLRDQLEGRKVAGRWVFDREVLLIEADRRRQEGRQIA